MVKLDIIGPRRRLDASLRSAFEDRDHPMPSCQRCQCKVVRRCRCAICGARCVVPGASSFRIFAAALSGATPDTSARASFRCPGTRLSLVACTAPARACATTRSNVMVDSRDNSRSRSAIYVAKALTSLRANLSLRRDATLRAHTLSVRFIPFSQGTRNSHEALETDEPCH